ncbi:MAG: hypothetical protein DRJ66_00680 [Thermoprotei archaeon]|nr:MAG: hypothetical protein DRJ66_00680 [Thermoprotei archaeon]RLF20594.1 MAG: hypothetical protein DRZ82_01625 [Thermoprotei archaeon]
MRRLRVGAQLIIWGKRVFQELPKILDVIATLNYEGIEASLEIISHYPNYEELLKERSLVLSGLHQGVGDMNTSKMALKVLKDLGGGYLIFSSPRPHMDFEKRCIEVAHFLNDVASIAKNYGVVVCYHNHDWEIADNGRGIKIILENTNPELVHLCMDTYWVKYGGLDPVTFMEENLDRIVYLHLKDGTEEDFRKRSFCELGRGIIDFESIIGLARRGNVEWLVVEQDSTKISPEESMQISRNYLREKFNL